MGQIIIPGVWIGKNSAHGLFPLISLNTLNAFLLNFLITPFSHHGCKIPITHLSSPALYSFTPSWCSKIYPFHAHDFTSSPKISQNNVDSLSWSPNTPINHLMVINRTEIIPPKNTLFYTTPKKLPHLPTNYPFHTINSTHTP